jgi:hypothetical protein
MSDGKLILVSGDCVCDHNYYKGKRPAADSRETRGFRVTETCGGALLLRDLIAQTTAGLAGWQTGSGYGPDFKTLPSEYHAFCLWEPQLSNPGSENPAERVEVWRAMEPPLGYGQPGEKATVRVCGKSCCGSAREDAQAAQAPDIIVIDDAGLGFRNASARDQWPPPVAKGRAKGSAPWVVLKLAGAIGKGDLWQALVANCRERLVVVVSADQLRAADVRISRGLSWEATAEDLAAELNGNPALQPLLAARHLIVTFRSDGAFWLDNRGPGDRSSLLVFDAAMAEGEWSESQGNGTTFGFMSCFVAAVVRQLCLTKGDATPDFEGALGAGLNASRRLRTCGHGPVLIPDPKDAKKMIDNPNPGFPYEKIADAVCNPQHRFVSAPVPQVPVNRGNWMMLHEWQVHARSRQLQRPYYEAAAAVAVLGPNALERFPVACFGGLQTVDRQEIESLRTIRRLIVEYEKGRPQKQPLSIGVFGPPGAGKSFGVTQIAQAVLGPKVEILTFNLSQFCSPQEITGAFHQVRDKALTGTTPVVFWDEFDAKGYEWLQYLLAPMQDGAFQDGPITHPIGMSVFVFAGATSPTYETFGPLNPDQMEPAAFAALSPVQKTEMAEAWREFVLRKGPDFKSRLVGFLNVLGPNPRQECDESTGRRQWRDADDDLCCPIRRALFIRGQFKVKDKKPLKMDMGVLRALLEIPHYKAGARSLVFLCQQLKRGASGSASRSDLPGRQLLDMHVDAAKFWEICERDLPFAPLGPALAAALHEAFRLRIKGNPKKAHLDVPFAQLSPDMQAANTAQALRIPENLRLAELGLVPGPRVEAQALVGAPKPADEEPLRQSLAQSETCELLAEAEHNGWMVERMLNGWTYGRIRDDANKKHPLLIPYNQLSEGDKDYDRHTIIGRPPAPGKPETEEFGYVDVVKIAGFRVVRPAPAAAARKP